MDYLHVSAQQAVAYMTTHQYEIDSSLVKNMILSYHKIFSAVRTLAEKLRKADSIDLIAGFIRLGVFPNRTRPTVTHFSCYEFQLNIYWEIDRYALRHPLRPLPMLNV